MADKNMNTVINIRVPVSMRNELNSHLEETGQNISDFMRNRINEYFNEKGSRVPFPEALSVEEIATSNLKEIASGMAMADNIMARARQVPSFNMYFPEPDHSKEEMEHFVIELHKLLGEIYAIYQRICDISIISSKQSMILDKRIQHLMSSIYDALKNQESIDGRDIYEISPCPYGSLIHLRHG